MIDAEQIRRRIIALSDEIAATNFERHSGHSRPLSFVQKCLDEAEGWAVRYGVAQGSHVIVPRDEVVKLAMTMKENQ
jgi:hypothetical protein